MTALRRTTSLLLLLLLTATAAPAGAQEIARPERATPVDADLGVVAWSAYDKAVDGFRIAVRVGSGPVRTLGTVVAREPLELDVGDDARGRRVVVYAACPEPRADCDVRLARIADGSDAAVAVAARPDRSERAPTISRGRLAWVEGGRAVPRPRVLLHTLDSAAAPVALPALPRRRCGIDFRDGRRRCVPVTGYFHELELRGSRLAQVATSEAFSLRTGELRLVDTRRRTSARLIDFGVGESGQRLLGPSFEGDDLFAYKACFGDPSGCNRNAGTFRHRLADGRLELAASRRQLSGFAVDRGRLVAAEGDESRYCEVDQGAYPGVPNAPIGPCPITAEPLPTRWTDVTPKR